MMKIRDILAIMAVALTAVGCNQQDDGLQQDERVPILLKATVKDAAKGPTQTRTATTATTQNTEFLNGQLVKAWIKENDGTHTNWIKNPIIYEVKNDNDGDADDGDLDPVSDTQSFFFPIGVNIISIFGVHPSTYTSNTDFTVAADQTSDADYAASDLCYSPATNHTRTTGPVDTNGRQIMTFQHALSKIVVEITTNTGKTLPATVKLLAKRTTKMTWSTGSDFSVQAEATGDASYITMGLNDDGTGTKVSGGAIIPPQTIAAGTSFISFTVADLGPMIYPLPANTTFTSGKRYTYNIKVNNVGITATTDIDDWGTTVNGGIVMGQPGEEYKKNPLWYVAEYNLKSDLTFDKSTDARYQGYIFKWNQGTYSAMNLGFTANTTGYNGYALPNPSKTVSNGESGVTWHLPTAMELQSILPSALNSKNILNHSSFPNSYTAGVVVTEPACTFGYNNDTKYGEGNSSNPASPTGTAFKSYWSAYTANSDVRYAIRFLGTPYCSVWKYQMLNGSTTNARLIISAKLIDKINDDNTSAMAAKMTEITNGGYDWSENLENGAIVRTFYICGFNEATEGNSPGGTRSLTEVDFWSATPNPSNSSQAVFMRVWTDNTLYLGYDGITRGFNVRLFRDN